MKKVKKAKDASDSDLMRLVCDSLAPKFERRDDVESKFQAAEAKALDWRRIAKLAADDLRSYETEIRLAAATSKKEFFIDLGKCLSSNMKAGYDRLDNAIAGILRDKPSIKARDAVRELVRLKHPCISEE